MREMRPLPSTILWISYYSTPNNKPGNENLSSLDRGDGILPDELKSCGSDQVSSLREKLFRPHPHELGLQISTKSLQCVLLVITSVRFRRT